MLVVDRHALVPVDLLHLFDEVLLGLADSLDLQQLLGVLRALHERLARADFLASTTSRWALGEHREGLLLPRSPTTTTRRPVSSSSMRTTPEVRASTAAPFGRARLEQLDDAGQPVGDVLADHAAGVEGPHRELRAGLADGLGGDDADRLAELDHAARWPATGRSRRCRSPCGDSQVSTERARTGSMPGSAASRPTSESPRTRAGGEDSVPSENVTGSSEDSRRRASGLEVAPLARLVLVDPLDPYAAGAAAVVFADDELLGDVDQPARQVARVRRTQRRVGRGPCGRRGSR